MLILTPTPLETEAEKALFAELAGWDTGGSVRGAVMASLPVVDGPMQRRLADAVLFVPEGLAVVRVVEVVRQSGVVTALPDGAWTIGPGAGPGDVLQLAGGGSTPLEGLMRAGMDAAVRLRRAGLEPGRIARLTVLTGDVTGLVPADGDLGDGDQVALLDAKSLLLGVARASRYAGTDNPRLWTTADVRSGIEALGVAGRSPSVEELNGEGFPYSPYVLRRRELLVPMSLPSARGAAMEWSSDGPAARAAAPVAEDVPAPTAARPLVDPAAAARVAVAAAQAQEARESAAAQAADAPAQADADAAPAGQVAAAQAGPAADAPAQRGGGPAAVPGPSADDSAAPDRTLVAQPVLAPPRATAPAAAPPPGSPAVPVAPAAAAPAPVPPAPVAPAVGGTTVSLPPAGTTVSLPAVPPAGGSTAFLPAAAPAGVHDTRALPGGPAPATVDPRPGDVPTAGPGAAPDDRAGLRELFGDTGTGHLPPVASTPPPVEYAEDEPGGRRRGPLALVLGAALLVLVLVGIGGSLLLRDPDDDGDGTTPAAATTGSPTTAAAEVGPSPEDVAVVDGVSFTLRTGQVHDSCRDHAYGAVAGYFARADCAGLSRALWSAQVDGGAAVVSVARVAMPDEASARALQELADTDGSGNVNDLLREGVRVDGAPARLSGAQYDSALDGVTVTIVETAWVDAAARGDAATLDGLAASALELPSSAVPVRPVD